MYERENIDKEIYSQNMEAIKWLNYEQDILWRSRANLLQRHFENFFEYLGHMNVKKIVNSIKRSYRHKIVRKKGLDKKENTSVKTIYKSNYFCKERFVVYTAVFGMGNIIKEPLIKPDNCDFVIITDVEIKENSAWKKADISCWDNHIKNFSNVEKNRFFKMNPHLIFPEYNYSIYVDGTLRILTDLTELINRIPQCGIAMYSHPKRDCVFKEIEVNSILKRDSKDNLKRAYEHLKENNMPHLYGMMECTIIARRHTDKLCIKIMEEWWEEFCNYSKRDQISLPLVLYKNNIPMQEITVLGEDICRDYAFIRR